MMIKQIIKNILTKIFGYKYYVAVYQAKHEKGHCFGNTYFKVKRLHNIELDFIKCDISKRNKWKKDNIILLNLIRIKDMSNKKFEGENDG